MPARGALFAACVRFARNDPSAYHDNGYIPALVAKGDAEVGRQVAMWMTLCAQMEFLNLPVATDRRRTRMKPTKGRSQNSTVIAPGAKRPGPMLARPTSRCRAPEMRTRPTGRGRRFGRPAEPG